VKNKAIIAALLFSLILCSCGEKTNGEADITESGITLQTEETEASETTQITEVSTASEPKVTITEPQLLELPLHERKTPDAIMPDNTEFTVDLKDITPETDLFALTNMEKHSPGDTFKMDLDGDGTEEEITAVIDKTDIDTFGYEFRVFYIIINGESYAVDYDLGYVNAPNEVYTCDIDSEDGYIEFACTRSILTNDYYSSFYRYENGELRRIFDISYDTPSGQVESEMFIDEMNASVTGKPIITDGSGVITAARRLGSQTWLAYSHYAYDSESGKISLICEPVYPYYYENINNFAAAEEFTSEFYSISDRPLLYSRKEIKLYAETDLNSESVTLAPQRIYFTAEYPYILEETGGYTMWIYIVAEDGTAGWFYYDRSENDELLTDIFSLLVIYD